MESKEQVVVIVVLPKIRVACFELQDCDHLSLEAVERVVDKPLGVSSFHHHNNKSVRKVCFTISYQKTLL